MNREQFLLNRLAEEATEVAKAALKAAEFGLNSDNNGERKFTNRKEIQNELNDLLAISKMLNVENGLNFIPDHEHMDLKQDKVEQMYLVSKRLGRVTDDEEKES